ncbi:MAG TPA: hypothetical protein VMV92_17825 [Streptosporangiaceae bacterium]|nr:hypothetical protein [Streptosporangiaceae bacterium]
MARYRISGRFWSVARVCSRSGMAAAPSPPGRPSLLGLLGPLCPPSQPRRPGLPSPPGWHLAGNRSLVGLLVRAAPTPARGHRRPLHLSPGIMAGHRAFVSLPGLGTPRPVAPGARRRHATPAAW